jgi:hypothetical protein
MNLAVTVAPHGRTQVVVRMLCVATSGRAYEVRASTQRE